MGAGFTVTADSLSKDSSRIASNASNIQGHLAFLKNAVESVVNSGLQGVAANEAAALHAKLDQAGRDIKEATDFFATQTGTAARNYASREEEVRQAFSSGG